MITSLNWNIFCVTGHPVTGEFPSQRPVRLNKRLSKKFPPICSMMHSAHSERKEYSLIRHFTGLLSDIFELYYTLSTQRYFKKSHPVILLSLSQFVTAALRYFVWLILCSSQVFFFLVQTTRRQTLDPDRLHILVCWRYSHYNRLHGVQLGAETWVKRYPTALFVLHGTLYFYIESRPGNFLPLDKGNKENNSWWFVLYTIHNYFISRYGFDRCFSNSCKNLIFCFQRDNCFSISTRAPIYLW